MIREIRFAIILTAVVMAIATIGISFFAQRAVKTLRAQTDSLKLTAAATDVLVDQVRQQAAQDSVRADSVELAYAALMIDLDAARRRTARVIIRVDSVRLTVDEDTLTAGLQALLAAERAVCEACAAERDLERIRANSDEEALRRIRPLFNDTRLLLFTLQRERDSAFTIIGGYQNQLDPSLFRRFFRDLPQKVACAASGAAVAALNDGDALVGADIGLAGCILIDAIF